MHLADEEFKWMKTFDISSSFLEREIGRRYLD